MKSSPILAIILIIAGVAALAYQGFTYTTREKTLDIGPIHVTAEKTHDIPLPPVIGIIAIAGGIFLLVAGRTKV
jgi:hypothetical protein